MPRKYVYKKRGKTQNYTLESLERAVKSVQSGVLSIRQASDTFNVPRSTIGDRISGKHAMHVPNGRPPHIPRDIEEKIVNTVKMAARRGIGLTRQQILRRTNLLCTKSKIGSGYSSFKAGKDWWEGVKRRHPDLTIKKPEKLSATRARMMNKEVIKNYFSDLGTIIDGLNLSSKPQNIWNCDEMSKNFEHAPVKVVATKGEQCVGKTSAKSTNITVMACVSASGKRMPPMFVVKGKTNRCLRGFNVEAAPLNSSWAYQTNGWMDDTIGELWFTEVFLKYCGPERPQLLVLDGHSSHETLAILMRAMDENIHILALPPHTTHQLQPLDRSVFGPLNRAYNKACSQYVQENPLNQINKWSFPGLFRTAWESALTSQNISSGFRACGIYPYDPSVITDEAFAPSQPTDVPVAASSATSLLTPTSASQPAQPPAPLVTTVSAANNDHETMLLPESLATIGSLLATSQASVPALTSFHAHPPSEQLSEPLSVDEPMSQSIYAPTSLESVQDVLDISDPAVLLQLLSTDSGLELTPLLDQTVQQENVVSLDLDQQITAMFLPPELQEPRTKQPTRVKTHHRLLTTDEILCEKKMQEENKRKKDEKKMNKKIKLESK